MFHQHRFGFWDLECGTDLVDLKGAHVRVAQELAFYGVVIDINKEQNMIIVEFGSNKNCRIPMTMEAVSASEKPGAAAKAAEEEKAKQKALEEQKKAKEKEKADKKAAKKG